MPSLGLGLGDRWPGGPFGAEDDGEGGTILLPRVDSERKPGICVCVRARARAGPRACVCVCVHTCVWCAYRCTCQSECSHWGPEREAQVESGSGVVMACVLSPSLSSLSGNGGVYGNSYTLH